MSLFLWGVLALLFAYGFNSHHRSQLTEEKEKRLVLIETHRTELDDYQAKLFEQIEYVMSLEKKLEELKGYRK